MEPRIELKIQDQQSDLEGQEKDGKMTSTNSSNKNLKKVKTQSKAAIKPTKLEINIAKDRRRWALLEETYTMTVEERQKMKNRENNQSRPAR